MATTPTETATEAPKADVRETVAPETKPVEVKPAEAASVEAPKVETPAPVKAAKPATTPKPAKAAAVRAKKSRPVKAAASVKKIEKKARPAKAAAVKTTRRPARAVPQIKTRGVEEMTKQTNQAAFFAADQFKNVFGDVNEKAKEAVERSAKIVEELADLTRGNVEALVASSKVAAKGVETLSQDAADYGRKSFEEASATLKSFAEVKSATDFFKLQSDFARSAFDAAVAESARVSEAFIKIAGDVAEPIASRYTVAAERVKTLAA